MLDVGTNNESLLDDDLYNGLEQRRERGAEYDELVQEFIEAVQLAFPGVLTQLEDFGNSNAFRLLAQYRDQACLFDDDIQGTGAVALSGLLSALRITGGKLEDQRILFHGAGQAGIGIGNTVVAALVAEGVDEERARQCCWYFDTRGLLVSARNDIPQHKAPFAHAHAVVEDLQQAVEQLQPTALLGCGGQPGVFTPDILRSMAEFNERPIVFALSNPTSKAECSAQAAYAETGGRALFASGSPFAAVDYNNRHYVPGQGNNAYIFPGVGLGVVASGSRRVTDEMFLAAARCLADQVSESDLELGRLYPPLSSIRQVSALIAAEVASIAWNSDLAARDRPDDILAAVHEAMYEPRYPHYA